MSETKEIFTVTWGVKNFSMCPVYLDENITSPAFRIPGLGNTDWRLLLSPKGVLHEVSIGCYLKNLRLGDEKDMKVSFKLSVHPSKEKYFENDFGKKKKKGDSALFLMPNTLMEKDTYLPNDTLTIKCSMESKDLCDTKEKQLRTLARDFLNGKNFYNIKQCHIETTLCKHTKSITWPIQRFLSLAVNEELVFPVRSVIEEMPSFYVKIHKNSGSPPSIQITQEKDLPGNIFVKLCVSVINGPTDVNCCISDEFLFISGEVWDLSHFAKWNELEEKGYFEYTGGTLHIQFDFTFSIEGQTNHFEKFERYPCIPRKRQVPVEVLTLSTTNAGQAVVTLRAGDRSFIVHKSVLKVRSEVFSVMFENDMKEKETGVVDIPDVDPETLGEMITFLYSGTAARSLSTSDVKKLYAVGHKYQVLSLIDYCSSILISSLSVSNVCDVLELSDLYQNRQLLKCAEDFILYDSDPHQVFMSQDWKTLMEKNGTVAAKILYKMVVN